MPIYLDYTTLSVTVIEQEYKFIDGTDYFVATEITFLSNHPCLVKFGESSKDQVLIISNQPMTFNRPTQRIQYVRTNAADAILQIWAEGNVIAS